MDWASKPGRLAPELVGLIPSHTIASMSEKECSGCFNEHQARVGEKSAGGQKHHLLRALLILWYVDAVGASGIGRGLVTW